MPAVSRRLRVVLTVATTILAAIGVSGIQAPTALAGTGPITGYGVCPGVAQNLNPNSGPNSGGTAVVFNGFQNLTGPGIVAVMFSQGGVDVTTTATVTAGASGANCDYLTFTTPAVPWSGGTTYMQFVCSAASTPGCDSSALAIMGSGSYYTTQFSFTGGGGGGGGGGSSSGGGGGTQYDWESANSPSNPAWLPQPVVSEAPPVLPAFTPLAELSLTELAQADGWRFAMLSAEEFGRFTPAQIGQLSADQAMNLPSEVLGALTPEQLAALPASVLGALSAEQFAAIPAATLASMSPTTFTNLGGRALQGMTATQLAAVPAALLAKLTPEMSGALPASSLAALSSQQLKAISTKSLRAVRFTPATLAGLTADTAEAWVKSGLLKSLSAKELADGIKKMSPEAAAALFADPEKLPAEAIAAMTPEQIAKMPPSAIGKLNREQVASFTPSQVKNMSLKQIRAFNDEFCDSVKRGQKVRCYGSDVRDYLADEVRVIVESRLYNGR